MVKNGDFILKYRFNIFRLTGDEAECMATEYIHLVMFKFTIVRMRRAQSEKVQSSKILLSHPKANGNRFVSFFFLSLSLSFAKQDK